MERPKESWSEQQKRDYIQNAEDNLLIIAGPGIGKTTLLSRRILSQIKAGEKLSSFLLLAFTREAVREFRRKIRKHLYRELNGESRGNALLQKSRQKLSEIRIQTIYSFCRWVLETYTEEDIPPRRELPGRVLELLRERPELMERLRRRFRKIYADELQDLDRVQQKLLLTLASDRRGRLRKNSLFMVGDPRQMIFQSGEGGLSAFWEMRKRMERQRNASVIVLLDNYRANGEIVSWVNENFREKMKDHLEMHSRQISGGRSFSLTGIYRYPGSPPSEKEGRQREEELSEAALLKELMEYLDQKYPALREKDYLVLCPDRSRTQLFRRALSSCERTGVPVLEARCSKGLNANVVIVTGEGKIRGERERALPGGGKEKKRAEGEADEKGSREDKLTRLEYVAATRAKHALIFLLGPGKRVWFPCSSYRIEELESP